MRRVLSTVTLLGLLVATAAAFAITEHLKLIRSPVYGARVSKLISPVCGCVDSKATIRLRLRHPDRVTVTILDAAKHTVATVATGRPEPKKLPFSFVWNGRTEAGTVAPDGAYRPEIHLADARRTILFPNRIVVDTKVPEVRSASVGNDGLFTPGDHRTIAIQYSLSERAHVVVYLAGRQIIRGRRSRPSSVVKWAGTRHGTILRPGRYRLSIGAVDLAGNRTPAAGRKDVVVRIRALSLTPKAIRLRAGERFTVGVVTGAPSYTWRLAGRYGTARRSVLRLRAPGKTGSYRLVISVGRHKAIARVSVVRK